MAFFKRSMTGKNRKSKKEEALDAALEIEREQQEQAEQQAEAELQQAEEQQQQQQNNNLYELDMPENMLYKADFSVEQLGEDGQAVTRPAGELASELESLTDIFNAAQVEKPAPTSFLENLEVEVQNGITGKDIAFDAPDVFGEAPAVVSELPANEQGAVGEHFNVSYIPPVSVENLADVCPPEYEPECKEPKYTEPYSLAFADLTGLTELDGDYINYATEIYGIAYPECFNPDTVNFNGRAIDHSDFSRVHGLKFHHIAGATNITGVIFPAEFDVENSFFVGKDLCGCDFSAVYALKWKHIEGAADISAIKYPSTFDLNEANFEGRNISASDFSLLREMNFECIKNASSIRSVKYPSDFNLETANFYARSIDGSDFSSVSRLQWHHIKDAAGITSIVYPSAFDTSKAVFSGRDISGSDFLHTSSLRWAHIKNAARIKGLKYPSEFDTRNADFTGKDISFSNLSRVSGLTFKNIERATDIRGIVYPPSFDTYSADFTGKNIDNSDFSLLKEVSYESVALASSRKSVSYPIGYEEPAFTPEEIQVGMIYVLQQTHKRGGIYAHSQLAADAEELYPGMQNETIEEYLTIIKNELAQPDGERSLLIKAKGALTGEKLYLTKLGWKCLVKKFGIKKSIPILTEILSPICQPEEKERVASRIEELSCGEHLTAEEKSQSDMSPLIFSENNHSIEVLPQDIPEVLPAEQEAAIDAELEKVMSPEDIALFAFDIENSGSAAAPAVPAELPATAPDVAYASLNELDKAPNKNFIPTTEAQPAEPYIPTQPTESKAVSAENVTIPDFYPPTQSVAYDGKTAENAAHLSTDEQKAVRTGIMGMLLYIKRNSSDEKLSFAELSKAFLKIYPNVPIKEASAMAQFSSNVLSGTGGDMREKLFSFALKAPASVKRYLLEYALEQYKKSLADWDDEQSFLVFLRALCETLFEDSFMDEYNDFLALKGIQKHPDTTITPSYEVIPFSNGTGKVNLYSNENFPYDRTLEMVGFAHHTFEAICPMLKIEVSDDRPYDDIGNLITREAEPGLRQFVVIDSPMGFLYVEKRTLEDWKTEESDVWRAAERNMENEAFDIEYCFSTPVTTPYRYLEHDLASYILFRRKLLKKLAGGKDMIIGVPCREMAYFDTYSFAGAEAMLKLVQNYNCNLTIDGEEYEHSVATDIFIYRVVDGSLDRIRNEDYILLSDSDARHELLREVAPENRPASDLTTPWKTDEVVCLTEQEIIIQEAVYTALKLYTYMNGENDYTVAENALMAIFDDVFIPFDAQYPHGDGREAPDPLDHFDECAKVIASASKAVNWLLVQAFEKLCEKEVYETATATKIRKTVLDAVYGESANVVWLSAGAADDYNLRMESTHRFHEQYVENAHLYFLDSEVETVMHALTLMFHQFGNRYALGQVRRHIVKIIPDIKFTYEQSQSAWLPEQDSNIELEVQSLGMVMRSVEPRRKDAIFQGLANAIGDTDLAECGWPLMVFAKMAKNAYLDPSDAIKRYFSKRSELIPTASALKTMSYKDLNAEFLKHSRLSGKSGDLVKRQTDSSIAAQDIADPLAPPAPVGFTEPAKPELCLANADTTLLGSELSYIIEPAENSLSSYLRETAYTFASFFRMPDSVFNPQNDPEAEMLSGILRSSYQLTVLRSLAWTITDMLRQQGRELSTVNRVDVDNAAQYINLNNGLTYRADDMYSALCGTPVNSGLYIPIQQEYIFFAQSQVADTPIASLFTLQQDLSRLVPVMRTVYDCLRLSQSGAIIENIDILGDALAAWCAMASVCSGAFAILPAPSDGYSLERISRA